MGNTQVRHHRSAGEVESLLQRFELSGLTQAAFARQQHVSRKTLNVWLKNGGKRRTASRFVTVDLPPEPRIPVTLRLGDLAVELPSIDHMQLAALVRAIAGALP